MRSFGCAFFNGDDFMKLGFFGNPGRDDKQAVLFQAYETISNLIKNENADELVFLFDFDFSNEVIKIVSPLHKNGYKFSTTIILPDKDFKLHPDDDIYDKKLFVSDFGFPPSKTYKFYMDYVDALVTYVYEVDRDSYVKYVLANNRSKKMFHIKYNFFVE